MKLGNDIWLPISLSNPYNFLAAVVERRRLDAAFYTGLSRVCTPEQDGDANLEIVYSY